MNPDDVAYDNANVTPPPPTPTQPYKALIAFVFAFVGALTATLSGRTDLVETTWLDWVIIVGTAVVTAGGVYQVTNPAKSVTRP